MYTCSTHLDPLSDVDDSHETQLRLGVEASKVREEEALVNLPEPMEDGRIVRVMLEEHLAEPRDEVRVRDGPGLLRRGRGELGQEGFEKSK